MFRISVLLISGIDHHQAEIHGVLEVLADLVVEKDGESLRRIDFGGVESRIHDPSRRTEQIAQDQATQHEEKRQQRQEIKPDRFLLRAVAQIDDRAAAVAKREGRGGP